MDNSEQNIECECDSCGKIYSMSYQHYTKYVKEDGKTYCKSCAMKLYGAENARLSQVKNGVSFEQWCIDNNRQDILNRWDYKLNKYSPNELGYSSSFKQWFKCPNGLHPSELKNIGTLTGKNNNYFKCKKCNSFGRWLVDNYGYESIDIYWSDKNPKNFFEINYGSNTEIWIKCPNCGNIKSIAPSRFIRQGLCCSKCSDGLSYPNKFAFGLLQQLNISFQTEYSPE